MGRIVTLLSHYYRPDDDPEILRAQAADWYVVLKGFPIYAINAACVDYLANEPRRKPAPGAIVELCRKVMPRPRIGADDDERLSLPKPERAPETKARASEIMERAGFTPKRLDAVMRRPMARTEAELYDEKLNNRPHWTETVAPDSPEMEQLRHARAANPIMAAGMKRD
jgi:hypothetical protein